MRRLMLGTLAGFLLVLPVQLTASPAKADRPFSASLNTTLNENGTLSGQGNATHLGLTNVSGVVGFDFSNFPYSLDVYYAATLTAANGDELFVSSVATLTDVASPPEGMNYSMAGSFTITGGTGRFAGATGSGAIDGTCTSQFGSPEGFCTELWSGNVVY